MKKIKQNTQKSLKKTSKKHKKEKITKKQNQSRIKRNSDINKSRLESKINIDKKFSTKQKILLVLSGAVIGILNGFFGGGGGMVCVPILQKVLSLDAKHSHATAIVVIFPLSLISAFIYVFNGYIQSFPLLTIGLGVVLGGITGAFALKFLPPKIVRLIFAVIMFIGGIRLIL